MFSMRSVYKANKIEDAIQLAIDAALKVTSEAITSVEAKRTY